MNTTLKLTKHQLVATISSTVAKRGDDHEVFAVTRELLDTYRKQQAEEMAALVYRASKSAQKNSTFKEGFAALVKRRDKVLQVVNTARAVHGFQKYALDELGVYSTQMEVMTGSKVWQTIHTHHEMVELFKKDRSHLDLLMAWGRTLVHGDEALAAAQMMSARVKAAYKQSLVAIGKAMKAKGNTKDLVPFGEGCWAVQWAVDAYEAAMRPEGKKQGAVLRGVGDAIKAAISSAFYAERQAAAREEYQLAHITQNHKQAWALLFPREDAVAVHKGTDADEHIREGRGSAEERHDADYGSEGYAGAECILVQTPWRVIDLGTNPSATEVSEAQSVAEAEYAAHAESLLQNAELMFAQLTCGVKEGDEVHDDFTKLKEAIYTRLAARRKERKEAKAFDKALSKAVMVVQTAMPMDAVSRRTFLAAFKDRLPLDQAVAYLAAKTKVEEPSAEELEALRKQAEFEARAEETARRETERKAQEEDRRLAAKEAALRSAKLDAELKAAREEARV